MQTTQLYSDNLAIYPETNYEIDHAASRIDELEKDLDNIKKNGNETTTMDDAQTSNLTTWSSQKIAFELEKAHTSNVLKKDLLLFSGEKTTTGDITLMDSIYNYDELIVFTHVTASNVEDGFITSLVINKHEYVTGYSSGFNKTYMLNTSTASNDRRAVFGFVDEYTIRICELSKGTTLISVYGIKFEEANQGTSDIYEIVTCDIASITTESFMVSNFSKTFAEIYVNITNGKDVLLKASYAAENYVYLFHPSAVNNASIAFSTTSGEKTLAIIVKNDNSLNGKIVDFGERITDATPTRGSTNPVQSGGVFTALEKKQNAITGTAGQVVKIGANGTPIAVTEEQPDTMWVICDGNINGDTITATLINKMFDEIYAAMDSNIMVLMHLRLNNGSQHVLQATTFDLSACYFSTIIPTYRGSQALTGVCMDVDNGNSVTGEIWQIGTAI